MNPLLRVLLVLSAFVSGALAQGLEVIGWVPPYAISQCQSAVTADFGSHDARDGLTRVGLQFWTPNANGTIKYANHEWYVPRDTDVAWWRNWGTANGIKVLLTIYNNTGSWDWNLARSAFATNRTTFVHALVAEMDRLALDGIDLDLEGLGSLDADRAAFGAFVNELSTAVRARNKLLTVDSFHYIWNAPNHTWWPDWVGKVDQVHSMGYTDLFEGGTTWHKYSYQQQAGVNAGYPASAILMGFPAWVDNWGTSSGRGTSALAHVQEVRFDLAAPSGIAIWDLQLSAPGWRNPALWAEIAALKGPAGNRAPVANAQSVATNHGQPVAITLTGSDPDLDPITFQVATLPLHGLLGGTPPNLTYAPAAGWSGIDTFSFTVTDGQLTSAPATVTVTTSGAGGALPVGWSTADVGNVGLAGSATWDAALGRYALQGAGAGLAGSADSFRYAWTTMTGDGEIRVQLASVSGGAATGLAGVMIRETTAAGAKHHFLGRRNDGRLLWIRRNSLNRSTSTADTGAAPVPVWLRLVRSGTTITAYRSADGASWTRVNNAKLSMNAVVTVGLAVAGGSSAARLGATFTNVAVVP